MEERPVGGSCCNRPRHSTNARRLPHEAAQTRETHRTFIQVMISLQNRAPCRGLQANGRGKAAPSSSRQALACPSRRHVHVPERFCKLL